MQPAEPSPAVLRIGELSRRVGLSDHVLRAWETRYGLLRPERSAGGFRLYSDADEDRVRQMQGHLARGLSASQAAALVLSEDPAKTSVRASPDPRRQGDLAGHADTLRRRLDELDEGAAQEVLDRLLADFTVETVLRDVLLPYLRALGDRWQAGEATVAQEHFASNLLRGRLANLARGWGHGLGPQVVLACPPGEHHELGLLSFGIVLHRCGWRVRYLGVDTPIQEVIRTASQTAPDLVVVAATNRARLRAVVSELSQLSPLVPVAVAGAGATQRLAELVGARLLDADPVTAAQEVAARQVRGQEDVEKGGLLT